MLPSFFYPNSPVVAMADAVRVTTRDEEVGLSWRYGVRCRDRFRSWAWVGATGFKGVGLLGWCEDTWLTGKAEKD